MVEFYHNSAEANNISHFKWWSFIVTQLRLINIGYTMKPRGLWDLDARGNLYKHPRAKCKGVYGFQGDLNPVGPEGSSYKVFIL